MSNRSLWTIFLASASIPMAAASASGTCAEGVVLAHGTVHYIDVVGGCWQFVDDDQNSLGPELLVM